MHGIKVNELTIGDVVQLWYKPKLVFAKSELGRELGLLIQHLDDMLAYVANIFDTHIRQISKRHTAEDLKHLVRQELLIALHSCKALVLVKRDFAQRGWYIDLEFHIQITL